MDLERNPALRMPLKKADNDQRGEVVPDGQRGADPQGTEALAP